MKVKDVIAVTPNGSYLLGAGSFTILPSWHKELQEVSKAASKLSEEVREEMIQTTTKTPISAKQWLNARAQLQAFNESKSVREVMEYLSSPLLGRYERTRMVLKGTQVGQSSMYDFSWPLQCLSTWTTLKRETLKTIGVCTKPTHFSANIRAMSVSATTLSERQWDILQYQAYLAGVCTERVGKQAGSRLKSYRL